MKAAGSVDHYSFSGDLEYGNNSWIV